MDERVVQINEWSIVGAPQPYRAPEIAEKSLKGRVSGHPKFDDGQMVRTSFIVSLDGGRVRTQSGSVYELGEPSPDYAEWCYRRGYRDPRELVEEVYRR
jgi:hypothetical protein